MADFFIARHGLSLLKVFIDMKELALCHWVGDLYLLFLTKVLYRHGFGYGLFLGLIDVGFDVFGVDGVVYGAVDVGELVTGVEPGAVDFDAVHEAGSIIEVGGLLKSF